MEIKQSEERGLDDVCRIARDLRHECFTKGRILSEEDKETEFEEVWKRYAGTIRSEFDRIKTSEETYRQISELYENQLKCSGEKYRVLTDSSLPLKHHLHFDDYANKATEIIYRYSK